LSSKRLWIHYFDCALPRRLGRKVSKELCIENPKIEEFIEACKELQIKCEAVPTKKYPRAWYRGGGLIIAYTTIKKNLLIKQLAEIIIKKIRKTSQLKLRNE